MIKLYTLKFAFQEIEQLYTTSILVGIKCRREYTYMALCIYLILQIVEYNQLQLLLPQIIAGIGMALELALYLLMRKFWTKKEIFITLNMIIMAVVCEMLRLFGIQRNQWYYGHHTSTLKIIIYLQGSQFVFQSFMFILTEAASIYNFNIYDTSSIISHCLITILLVLLRYQYEFTNRKSYLADLSKHQYDNLLEELLPSWVVILKYNKLLGQLQIEKINRHLKEKFSIDNDEAFREFLRKLIIIDTEYQQQFLKIEHELIKILKSKSEDHPVERFYGILDKKHQKQWKFRITQVYFKAFEPLVILLFEEIKEDKHENYLNQIEQRDQQSYFHSKISLSLINQQIQLMQNYHNSLITNSIYKKDMTNQLIMNLKKQLKINYSLYNINSNLNYLYQISYRQLKYDFQLFNTDQFLTSLCENLNLDINTFSKNSMKNKSPLFNITTDRNKLISIIINIVDFIKILLSIIQNDDNIQNQSNPLGKPIQIQIKKSKQYSNCIQFTLSHPNLNITSSIISLLHDLPEISLDDKKRNWGCKNYFELLNKINATLSNLLDIYKREIRSLTSISYESRYVPTSKNSPRKKQFSQFNTVGYIIAQYFVSQLGPTNQINYRQTILELDPVNSVTCYYGVQKTKISFTIYQNLLEFSQKVSQVDEPKIFSNDDSSPKKYSSKEITERLLNLDYL